jgi:hypothetical protein
MKAQILGEERRGLIALNTATHPSHQGKGLIPRLATKSYELGASLGYEFVIGIANAAATPMCVEKLGFKLICPLEARLGIGKPKKIEREVLFQRIWDDPTLTWRLSNPAAQYRLFNQDESITILSSTGKPGISAILLRESKDRWRLPALPSSRSTGPLHIYLGLDPTMEFRGEPYINIPMFLRPSPLNFIFLRLKSGVPDISATGARIRTIDFDAY